MRNLLCLVLMGFMLVPSSLFAQTMGGPDAFGYIWRDSNDPHPDAPVYNWITIDTGGVGTLVTGLDDDNSIGWINYGFGFPYYWGEFDRMRLGSNGWASFVNTANISHGFPNIPVPGGSAGDNYLAPMMSDLNFAGSGNPAEMYYWTNFKDKFIVTWKDVPYWINGSPQYTGSNTFQMILDSTDRSITFQYKQTSPIANLTTLNDMVVGIENITGDMGFQVLTDIVPSPGYAIKFYYPDTVTYQVKDIKVESNLAAKNSGRVKLRNSDINVSTLLRNTGNQDVVTPFTVRTYIRDKNFLTVYDETITVDTLLVDDTMRVTQLVPFNTSDTGMYNVRTVINVAGDQNALNNSIESELIIIDTTLTQYTINSAPGPAVGSISWGSSESGAAQYFHLPGPVTITDIDYYISFNNPGDGYIAQIRDDDGPNGTPGTILFSDTTILSFTQVGYSRTSLNTPLTISGGIYVGWIQSTPDITLGQNGVAPISYNSYEIINGLWSVYRENAVNDMKITLVAQGSCNLNPSFGFADTTLCAGDTLELFAPSGFDSYNWSTGATTPSISVSSSGSFYADVTLSACSGSTDTVSVNFNTPTTPTVSWDSASSTLTSSTASTYQWYKNDTLIPGATGMTYTATESGDYTVVTTDAAGCSAESAAETVVIPIPNGILTPGTNTGMTYYPNPVNNTLIIKSERMLEENTTVHVFDPSGKSLMNLTWPAGSGSMSLNTAELQNGIYIIRVESDVTFAAFRVQVIH